MPTRSPASSPPSLAGVAARVDQRIDGLFEAEVTRWQAVDPTLAEPLVTLRRLVGAGGKRLRPAFCYWGFVGAGGEDDDPRVIDAGAGLELLHAFALVHDDVMDGSPTRRGATTAHVEFGERHRRNTWRGETRRFGEGVAILIGDIAHVYADLLLTRAAAGQAAVAPVWHELRLELNVGQYLDVLGTARGDRDPATARRIARYKSGKYTIERPLHLGAALADRFEELGESLTRFGDPLGEAFQLRDDVLGAFGDERLTGKPVGQDLREGKPTPLLAAATRRATPAQARVLDLVGVPSLSDDEVAAVQQVLVDTGARSEIDARIDHLTGEAIAALDHVELAGAAHIALVELARYVATRDT